MVKDCTWCMAFCCTFSLLLHITCVCQHVDPAVYITALECCEKYQRVHRRNGMSTSCTSPDCSLQLVLAVAPLCRVVPCHAQPSSIALCFLSRFDIGFDDGPDLGGGPMAKCKWVVSALMGSAWNSLAWSTAVMSSCACSLHEFMLSNPL